MSGKEIAEKMLRDNGIYDVQVISVPGQLTDHYNPANKTVNLSEGVYMQRNAAAAAVAAHECGHAVQHAVGYSMLQLRSKLVPMVNISSTLSQFVLFAGIAVMVASRSIQNPREYYCFSNWCFAFCGNYTFCIYNFTSRI
jgi:Zn-dependent membrane protease YugP